MNKLKLLLGSLIFLVSLVMYQPISAQATMTSNSVNWYGIDFTKAKLIGSIGFTDPEDVKDRYFDQWNNLIRNEEEKYNIKKFFKKSTVNYKLDAVKSRNEAVNHNTLVIEDDHSISEADVRSVASAYKDGSNELGLVLVVESFNKLENKGYIWVTFFNTSTGEVIKTKRLKGKSGGFGLRNYWAKAILTIMKDSEKEFKL